MKMLRRSRIGGAAFCLNCRGKKFNWGKLRGKTHCGEVQSQLFLAELEIIERKKDRKLNISGLFLWQREKDSNWMVSVKCCKALSKKSSKIRLFRLSV